ncbi:MULTISPECIES: hypothetical protein [unclassified Blastococcus]
MTRTRRCVLLLVLTIAAVLAASLPANALYAETATSAGRPSVSTLTVAGPGNVRVETSCVTTTTVIRRVYAYDAWGTTRLVGYQETSSTAASSSNVESDTTVRTEGPQFNQYTTTQTIKDTTLYATARWNKSSTPGVTGYTMTAFLNSGMAFPIGTAAASATSYTDSYDADVVDLGARLSMVTLTSYGWTAPGDMSNVVTCG